MGQLSFTDLAVSIEDVKRIEDKVLTGKSNPTTAEKGDKEVAEKKESLPQTVCGYSRYDVVSAFHKELRRGDTENATYWLEVMMQGGVPSWYLSNYLYWIHAEELAMEEVHGDFGIYLGNLNTHGKKADPYQLYYAVMRFCRAKKWWQCEESSEMRLLWGKYAKIVKKKEKEQMLEIPYYAYDRHTSKGKKLMQEGKADLRYSGTWMGMIWRRKAIEQHQTIHVEWDAVEWEDGELEHWQYMEDNIC